MVFLIVKLIFIVLLKCVHALSYEDEYIIKTSSLPTDLNFMPTLSNGHLGYTVYGNAIYVNGIYNGHGGQSRRARLPNWSNLTSTLLLDENHRKQHDGNSNKDSILYEMNLKDGYFRSLQRIQQLSSVEENDNFIQIEQRTYAHRYYNRAILHELIVDRKPTIEELQIRIKQNAGNMSDAFDFVDCQQTENDRYKIIKATTKLSEHEKYQSKLHTIYIVFSENIPANDGIVLTMGVGQTNLYYLYAITIDANKTIAINEMDAILASRPHMILKKHIQQWRQFWSNFSIEIAGNLELARVVNAGIFSLANSLPSMETNQPNNPYYGLSPTGLGRGELDNDYEGHNFWDTEIWMLPVITQMNIAWTNALFEYRFKHLDAAKYNAKITGYEGARYPWESAFTGTEVTNPCCPEVAKYQIHISADIVFALQQFYIVNGGNNWWLCQQAWPLIEQVARYIVDRLEWNEQTLMFNINDVMGPDEYNWPVNNSVYTNVIFKHALEFAHFAECKAKESIVESWMIKAWKIRILYDEELDYHPEYENYTIGHEVKQADAILLGYPLQFPMSTATRLHNLRNYENVTSNSGPAMTWSMFSINYLDINEIKKSNEYFIKSYKDYVRHEFLVWSETKLGFTGSANFLTGIGGFLQSIINGYGGVRYQRNDQTLQMIIQPRHLLPGTIEFTIKGIRFANSSFALNVRQGGSTLKCLKYDTKGAYLIVENGNEIFIIREEFSVDLHFEKVTISKLDYDAGNYY